MNLKECEQCLESQMKEATILLLLRDDEVLLAMKKRGFGVDKWNGVGGKPNPGEDIVETAIREAQEEIGVTPIDIKELAVLVYIHQTKEKTWGMKVHAYVATKWEGEPVETEEMRPKWYKISDVPYSEMWWDDILWMPKVFAGKYVTGSFMFGENEELVEHYIEEVIE